MADVAAPQFSQIPFHHRAGAHPPSTIGFGFGLSASPTTSSWTLPSAPLGPWNVPISHPQPSHVRPMKRRLEFDEEEGRSRPSSDDTMDRSPTPERPRRVVPKRARTSTASTTSLKDAKSGKEGKELAHDGNDVDVGVLLASLPPETLLPLLASLISSQPSLKSAVLALIPRPTLETATQAIAKSAKKLLDAFPYSSTHTHIPDFGATRSFGFGVAPAFGSGRSAQAFHAAHTPDTHHTAGMRDEYIISRLRPHIQEFVSASFSYLPYFSCIASSSLTVESPQSPVNTRSHASALQSQHRDKSHPSETYLFLHALTTHILNQPALTQSLLIPQLLSRLVQEWNAWVDRVDQAVNHQGGMFGQEVVRSWEKGLDEFASTKDSALQPLREVRDRWVSKVGWLVGRQPMEES